VCECACEYVRGVVGVSLCEVGWVYARVWGGVGGWGGEL